MNLGINQNTILIGHSAGTNIILALLEQLTKPVKAVYLIAGYCQPNGMRHTTLKNPMIGRQSRRTQMSFIYSIHLTILSIVMKSKEEVYLTIWVEHLF